MNADSDRNSRAALGVKFLRAIGNRVRHSRRDGASFHEGCTDLTMANWDPGILPNVLYGPTASVRIYEELSADKPTMICRLGVTELAVMTSAVTSLSWSTALKLVSGDPMVRDCGLHQGLVNALCKLSGFFPAEVAECRKFVELMLSDLPEVDILGAWCKQEARFERELANAKKIRFRDLEPYMHMKPWSRVLEGKRVLVVHPFAETIRSQYKNNRHLLFADPDVLPEFDLTVIKAVQSIANSQTKFKTWFDALDSMKRQIEKTEFDIAIIGCGAYGMPLAAHVKRIGKKAVHLGGQTQLLFGIKGKRWETGHKEIARHFNEHWVYPDSSDKPTGYAVVEGGAYW